MPSPFPGMDPYLEDPGLWPDFHNALATHLRDALNQCLPTRYYARLEAREELGVLGKPRPRVVIPDVVVASNPLTASQPSGGTAVALRPEVRSEVSPWIEFDIDAEPLQLNSVEIRDARSGHELVTLIEILSPSNKQPGPDRDKYLKKRFDLLASAASLVEIDLLREGERAWNETDYCIALQTMIPRPEYLIAINRSWKRTAPARLNYQMFSIPLPQALPVIPVPLQPTDQEPTLDLQHLFQAVYDGGGYHRGAVDYTRQPLTPLPERLREWAATCLSK